LCHCIVLAIVLAFLTSLYSRPPKFSPATYFILKSAAGGIRGYNLGNTGGEQAHTLIENELPAISGTMSLHGQENGTGVYHVDGHFTGTTYASGYKAPPGTSTGASSVQTPGFAFGGGAASNNVPPTGIANYIIKF